MTLRIVVTEVMYPYNDPSRDIQLANVIVEHLDLDVLLEAIGEASADARERAEERADRERTAREVAEAETRSAEFLRSVRLRDLGRPLTAADAIEVPKPAVPKPAEAKA